MPYQLGNLQSLLYRLITAPSGVADGLAVERLPPAGGLDSVILGDDRLSAIERLDIYADMYFYRLLDCLKEDFPGTLAVIGDDNFHNLITGYLIEHRPGNPSILFAGRHFAGFIATYPLRDRFPYLADLARLERALIEVFHGPDATSLSAAELGAVAPEQWPTIRLRTHPALQIVDCRWRVTTVLRAIEEKSEWQPPADEPNRALVWRRDARTYYRELNPDEHAAFDLLRDGAALGEVCESIAEAIDGDSAETINRLLMRWVADGTLVRAE